MPWSSECWVLSQLFHSLVSSSLRGSLVLCFLPLEWNYVHIWGCWYFPWQSCCSLWAIQPAFHMVYYAYKLNKQSDSIQPCRTSFPSSTSVLFHKVLSVASWLAYRFLRRQVRWPSTPISFKNFPQFVVIHTVKGFLIANEAEIDAFVEFPCFLYDPTKLANLFSGSSAFSKPSLNI